MENELAIKVYPIKLTPFTNEYTEAFQKGMFKEMIRINVETCVHRKWETTQYRMESSPYTFIFAENH